jgi:histidinol dehydrogenase
VDTEARRIVKEVRSRGDEALRELTARFDAPEVAPGELVLTIDRGELERAKGELEADVQGALEVAARNIQGVARAELGRAGTTRVELAQGQAVTLASNAVASAGIYAPGGRGAYPSTVLMCCIPARVAGVGRVVVATPPGPDGSVNPVVLGACAIAGVDQVHPVGGAQAIAALAYGTESVDRVDLVAGPGNVWVNAAKRAVFGDVGVDGVAGPSELVVVMDASANPTWIALDLLAQAEHGEGGLLAALCPDRAALDRVADELERLVQDRPSAAEIAATLVEAPDAAAAVYLGDALAPEHLELALEQTDTRLAADRVAGAVFLGPAAAVAFGDYAAGSNHVLPTGGAARFSGPLGVNTFRRRTSVVELPAQAAAGLAPRVNTLARAEGFPVHGESAEARVGD